MRRELRYAAQGISIGLIASLTIFCALKLISRASAEQRIGHTLPVALVILTAIFALLLYRFVVTTPSSRKKSVLGAAVTELPKGECDKTKSA